MPLFSVRLTNEIVVMASDEAEAQRLALTHEPDEKRHARTEALGIVRTAEDLKRLAPQWDTGCIPYGRMDDASIGEIIGERVPSGLMAEPDDEERESHQLDLEIEADERDHLKSLGPIDGTDADKA